MIKKLENGNFFKIIKNNKKKFLEPQSPIKLNTQSLIYNPHSQSPLTLKNNIHTFKYGKEQWHLLHDKR